jgi:hypothetical protein
MPKQNRRKRQNDCVLKDRLKFQVIDPMFDTGDIKFSYLKINKVIIGM